MQSQHNQRVGEVVATDEFRDWYLSLNDGDGRAVARAVDRLEMMGVSLPFPYSSAIAESRCALRELRAQSAGRPLRVFYIFEARRDAVLLVGGDKTGDGRFDEKMIPTAERIWDAYRAEQGFEP